MWSLLLRLKFRANTYSFERVVTLFVGYYFSSGHRVVTSLHNYDELVELADISAFLFSVLLVSWVLGGGEIDLEESGCNLYGSCRPTFRMPIIYYKFDYV